MGVFALISTAASVGLVLIWRARVARLRREFEIVLGERIRVSREIHDTVLQSLIGVSLTLDVLTDHANDPVKITRALTRTREQVQRYIVDTRQWIWNLRSTKLETAGLSGAIDSVAAEACTDTGIAVAVDVVGTPRPIRPDAEQQLLRIAEEALANSIRHAHCTDIAVTLEYGQRDVRLCVKDNGRGFDATMVVSKPSTQYGLRTMRERAEELGGTVEIASGSTGTIVAARIPDGRPRGIRRWFARNRAAA